MMVATKHAKHPGFLNNNNNTCKHDVEHDPAAPHIDLLAIVCGVVGLHHLGC